VTGPGGSEILAVQEVSCHFGGIVALDRVSLGVREGEIFGLIGPNGAGKTTLFNIVTGLMPPTRGRLAYRGEAMTGLPPHRIAARGIARTFQNTRLFRGLSARENVMTARHARTRTGVVAGVLGLPPGLAEERAVRRRAAELLELVGLADQADVRSQDLPYGDQRRLEIARALALDPQLLLLDEPAAGMNPPERHALSELIRGLRARLGLTVLLIEHHVPLVMGLCDRIAVLDFGRLIALGDPAGVQADPAVIEAYLGL
jgi:branched-chain amino acid transport system ATP-binding protein